MNIRTQPVSALSIEELIVAEAHLGVLAERIHENGYEVPDSLKTELRAIERELQERLRADKERRLQILTARREALLSNAEKRKLVDAEIAALEKDLQGVKQRKTA